MTIPKRSQKPTTAGKQLAALSRRKRKLKAEVAKLRKTGMARARKKRN